MAFTETVKLYNFITGQFAAANGQILIFWGHFVITNGVKIVTTVPFPI
jgi:hypothetical protein